MSVLRRNAWQPRPWAGGLSYELASGAGWRVSVATIERDGPFTAFPGWHRRTMLIRGAGMSLGDVRVTQDDPGLAYPGDPPPFCRLIGGAVMVLNVFTASDAPAAVARHAVSGDTSIGPVAAALSLGGGLTYDGQALGELDAIREVEGPFTVSGFGSMLVVSPIV